MSPGAPGLRFRFRPGRGAGSLALCHAFRDDPPGAVDPHRPFQLVAVLMADRAAVTRGAVRGPDVAQVPGQVRPVGNGFHVIGLTCAAVLANPAHPAVIRDRVPGEPLPAFALGRRHAVRLAARAARQRNAHTRNDNDRRQMMASPFGPGETAAVDQALAASDEDLDGLLRAIRGLIAGDGREQAMAQVTLTLRQLTENNPSRLESLMLAALLRLAREQETGQETGR